MSRWRINRRDSAMSAPSWLRLEEERRVILVSRNLSWLEIVDVVAFRQSIDDGCVLDQLFLRSQGQMLRTQEPFFFSGYTVVGPSAVCCVTEMSRTRFLSNSKGDDNLS